MVRPKTLELTTVSGYTKQYQPRHLIAYDVDPDSKFKTDLFYYSQKGVHNTEARIKYDIKHRKENPEIYEQFQGSLRPIYTAVVGWRRITCENQMCFSCGLAKFQQTCCERSYTLGTFKQPCNSKEGKIIDFAVDRKTTPATLLLDSHRECDIDPDEKHEPFKVKNDQVF